MSPVFYGEDCQEEVVVENADYVKGMASHLGQGAMFGTIASMLILRMLDATPLHDGLRTLLDVWGGGAVGGAIAGAVLGLSAPIFESKALATSLSTASTLIVFLISIAMTFGTAQLTLAHVAAASAWALVAGVPMGLFIREANGLGSADAPAWHSRAVEFLNRRVHPRALSRHRMATRSAPFPPEWEQVLHNNVRLYPQLTPPEQSELRSQILVFLDEKKFEGCGGLNVTDEMRVTIAAYACTLSLHLDADYFPKLRSVLIYPDAYVPRHPDIGGAARERQDSDPRLGESWSAGVVVLSWADIVSTIRGQGDGRQLVYHEFAHQLDQEDGRADGVPLLATAEEYKTWSEVLRREYDRHCVAAAHGSEHVIQEYGATNPAEFFAVATEAFFLKPTLLKRTHPELYGVLAQYYAQDWG